MYYFQLVLNLRSVMHKQAKTNDKNHILVSSFHSLLFSFSVPQQWCHEDTEMFLLLVFACSKYFA